MTDAQWQSLAPLLPPEKPRTGRPNEDHWRIVNGILWVHRTGAPWRDLPRRYGPVGTVSSRFYRWRGAGIWQRVLAGLQAAADARGAIDWDLHFVDATIVRAHQHAAGARRQPGVIGGQDKAEALGRSQGGFSTKLHLRAEGGGKPITVVLTGGERNEQIALEDLLDQGAIAATDADVHVCVRARWRATRATAAQQRGAACAGEASGRSSRPAPTSHGNRISTATPTASETGSSG